MREQRVPAGQAAGCVLFSAVYQTDGRRLFAKGHLVTKEDAQLLEANGIGDVRIAELEQGEVGEAESALQIAEAIAQGPLEIRMAHGGVAILAATERCCLVVDQRQLNRINCAGSVVVATLPNFSLVDAGQQVARVKSAPLAILKRELEHLKSIIEESQPVIQAATIRAPSIGVLYSDVLDGERARRLFENATCRRLEQFGTGVSKSLASIEKEEAMVRCLRALLLTRPTLVLVASTTAPAGPADVVGRSMCGAGCVIERFLAPVEPGSLALLGYYHDIPVISAPGCHRSVKPNVLDLLLPPLLSGYRVSRRDIAGFGAGGLLA
ncbi:MAG TPA: hypothetical protein VL285_25255 [Bryobacteraceae bacterium]|jgi:molybdenum cofactor cytidylyltransferase|nr:hypothetical protein [Bryobacteraceae bacterium]